MVPVSVIELIIGVAVILATALSLWVNLNNDLKATLVEISARLHAIELLLASNQIKEK